MNDIKEIMIIFQFIETSQMGIAEMDCFYKTGYRMRLKLKPKNIYSLRNKWA